MACIVCVLVVLPLLSVMISALRPFLRGYLNRVWKGFCVIRDSAEIELVIREYRKNPAVIREFSIGCEAGFSLSVVRDS